MRQYLISYTKGCKVIKLDLDRLRPSARYVAKMKKKGIEVETYVIEEVKPKNL